MKKIKLFTAFSFLVNSIESHAKLGAQGYQEWMNDGYDSTSSGFSLESIIMMIVFFGGVYLLGTIAEDIYESNHIRYSSIAKRFLFILIASSIVIIVPFFLAWFVGEFLGWIVLSAILGLIWFFRSK